MPKIAKVVVQLSLNREFDYIVPPRLDAELKAGMQVLVPFGHSTTRGFITGFAESSPFANLKEILGPADQKAVVGPILMELARWMSGYYAAPLEKCVATVLPAAVRKQGAGFKERLMVFPLPPAEDELAIEQLRQAAPKQAAALDVLMSGGPMFLNRLSHAAGTTTGTLRALEKKGFVRIGEHTQERDPMAGQEVLSTRPLELMPQQADALRMITAAQDAGAPPVILLFGVTGSGKTEVYLQAIQHGLQTGRGAIVLVPEIALTPQTIERFRGRFGARIAVLHSHLSDGERHDEWHRISEGRACIAIGARSALFAPVQNLGIIVVDEEHEPTYKQDEAPRYNARDVAVMRGRFEKCAVVLGTATPSLETYRNATTGKYRLAKLPARVDHRQMPAVRVVDMRIETEREGHVNVLSRDLVEAIRARLSRAEQTILFLNRRGYATSVICPRCGFVVKCPNCSVSMTYHKAAGQLRCHICGGAQPAPVRCPNPDCRDPAIRFSGIGTQRVEAAIARIFPHARVQRMDSDTTTAKNAHRRILGEFRTGAIDILVGTQMIAKGLHFPNVTLVGVVCADSSLHMPDFRAAERTFQLLTQVAGRAGRGDVLGEVIVQTFTPFHPAIQAARHLDYEAFYAQEIEFRRELSYPPFWRLACVTLKGLSDEKVSAAGKALAEALRPSLAPQVILAGPAPAPLAKAKGFFRHQLILRAPSSRMISEPLRDTIQAFKPPKDVSVSIDVDALSLL